MFLLFNADVEFAIDEHSWKSWEAAVKAACGYCSPIRAIL